MKLEEKVKEIYGVYCKKETETEKYEKIKNVITEKSQEEKEEIKKQTEVNKISLKINQKKSVTMMTVLGVVATMVFSFLALCISISTINNAEKLLDIHITDYEIVTNLKVQKEIEGVKTEEEKQQVRNEWIEKLNEKIKKTDTETLNKAWKENAEQIYKIFYILTGIFIILFMTMVINGIRDTEIQEGIKCCEYIELAFKEIE